MKRNLLWSLIFLAVCFFGVDAARACSCLGMEKPTTEFRKTPVVFVGTVKSVTSADSRKFGDEFNINNLRTTFSVDEALKGIKGKEIDIYTSRPGGGSCGIEFQEGEQYLVYAYAGGGDEKKYFSTSICSRTRAAEDKDDEIAVLRSLAKGRFEPRIYGRVEEIMRGIFLLDRRENVPLAGIKIIARNSAGGVYQSTTDEKGLFRFVNVKPGNYRLELNLPATHKLGDDSWGFIEKQKTDLNFTVTGSDAPDFITIETRVDGRIKGRVLDFQGNPVGKGVRVTLVTKDTVGNSDDNIQYIGTDTDKKGFYEFEGIPQGEYYLGVNLDLRQPYKDNPYPKIFYPNAGGFENAALIKLGYGQKLNGFDINLPEPLKTVTVKGKVTKTDGSAAVGITVYVSNQARHDFEDFAWLKTDGNGEFTATCLDGLTYRFAVYEKDSKGFDKLSSETFRKIGAVMDEPLRFVIEK